MIIIQYVHKKEALLFLNSIYFSNFKKETKLLRNIENQI